MVYLNFLMITFYGRDVLARKQRLQERLQELTQALSQYELL